MPTKLRPSRLSSGKPKPRARSSRGATPKSRAGGASAAARRPDAPDYKTLLHGFDRVVPHALILLISTMPRAGLHILQPSDVHEVFTRSYSRQFHMEDRLTWRTVIGGQTLVDGGVDGGADEAAFESCAYRQDFMRVNGLEHVITAPVADPVFAGYPGALHVYRTAGQGAFAKQHVDATSALARRLGDMAANARTRRARGAVREPPRWLHQPAVRQFAFDSQLKPLLWTDTRAALDKQLAENMLNEAERRFKSASDNADGQTVGLADSAGEQWQFRCVKYASYPALADGPVVFFCMQPNRVDWDVVQPADFEADREMVQLAAAIPYMRSHFAQHPALEAIAKTAGVSAFHFHRRFTQLMGITPKHFLLECQIYEARRHLAEGRLSLPQLARACGFAHQSHFTSRFKQVTGMTPTRWRRYAQQNDTGFTL